ncbi:hypothetical protein SAMN04489735_101521 [Aneurinibacillus thermoaerophilus]|uniref:Normocyte binding protein 2b n=2 Tax=Aneurinibacillus thermoaerophilus TaxID=143495 RepID=A0A1G8AD47_ANETH|nr:hypothetical protein SAMN04489735_101521 [Aneurinibacillus thermoaerophilus]
MVMKDIVMERLSKMEDLEQRRLLKNIITGVFLNLVEYQEEMNRKLEERVFNEVRDSEEKYDVYVTVCSRDKLDPVHEFLYPMIPEDVEEKTYDMKSLACKVDRKEEVRLLTIFLQCNFMKIKKLIDSQRIFSGEIITTGGRYRIEVRLQQNEAYMHEIEKLYNIFLINGIHWRTINHPYANKFFDVMLVGCEGTLKEEEEILEITIDLEEYEKYKKLDMIPLWNIERLPLKNIGFPVPATDKVNFEHVLSLRKMGTKHGYLVEGNEEIIRYIKRTPEELIIVSPREKSEVWNVLKITQPVETNIGRIEYELVSNKRENSFVSGFARKQAVSVRAKGEIVRIINSFEVSRYLELKHIEISKRAHGMEQTYGMNRFINDNMGVESDKKIMRLRFKARESSSFILYDLMSFLVSEVQLYFPEYKCEGALS